MTFKELVFLTLRELAEKIRTEEVKPVELVEVFLRRIRRIEPRLKSFITITEKEALNRARRIERRLTSKQPGKDQYLLAMPMSLKDNIMTKGIRTTSGSKVEENNVPSYDATLVKRLTRAGAILIGKNNMSEYAFGITGANPFYGEPINPWDSGRVTGGSSSGSAAAVASSLCVFSLGTDSGGSVRIPASLCGVVGFKPTYGRVSLHGVKPLSWTLDNVGIFTKTVWDAAAVYETIAGPDPLDPRTAREKPGRITETLDDGYDIADVKICYERGFFQSMCSSSVLLQFKNALQVFEKLGAEILEIEIPEIRFSRYVTLFIMTAEIAALHSVGIKKHPEKYGEHFRSRIHQGLLIHAADYIKAQQARTMLYRIFLSKVFKEEKATVFVSPTTPIPAPKLGSWSFQLEDGREDNVLNLLPRYTSAFNLLGLPAVSIPCGLTGENLPVGLQIIGKPYDEKSVLTVAYEFEKRVNLHSHYPTLPKWV